MAEGPATTFEQGPLYRGSSRALTSETADRAWRGQVLACDSCLGGMEQVAMPDS